MHFLYSLLLPRSRSTLFPYTTLFRSRRVRAAGAGAPAMGAAAPAFMAGAAAPIAGAPARSEEHTSELQSRPHLVCRPLLEKKNSSERKTPADWRGHLRNSNVQLASRR